MFSFPFPCSGIPDLALAILKKLIGVCIRDTLQPAFYQFVPSMIWASDITYSKCTAFTLNLCYLQVLAAYKKFLS